MKDIEEFIRRVDASGYTNKRLMREICGYACMHSEWMHRNDTTEMSVYKEAVKRVTSTYNPSREAYKYLGNGTFENITWGELLSLYMYQLNTRENPLTFDQYFALWEVA